MNLFIGFPVARAKIADMISTSAPPLAHKTQHQDGGTDEIDVTGLTGAGGGLAVPFLNHLHCNPCSATANLNPTVTGSAVIALQTNGIALETFATAGSTATLTDDLESVPTNLTWSKNRQLDCNVKLRSSVNATATMVMFTGDYAAIRGFGFQVSGGKLYGYTGNGTTNSTAELEILGAASFTKYRNLKAVFTSGVDCKFYVDGLLLGTITTTLPSGSSSAGILAQFYITNVADTNTKYMVVHDYQVLINS